MDKNWAIIEAGIVVNTALASDEFGTAQGWIVLPDGYGRGDLYDDLNEFHHPDPAPPPPIPLSLVQIACAQLTVDGWDVTGVERSTGITGAFVADTDTAWVFLASEQPDTDYIIMPPDGFTKFTDHVEVTRTGLSALSFAIFRVQ